MVEEPPSRSASALVNSIRDLVASGVEDEEYLELKREDEKHQHGGREPEGRADPRSAHAEPANGLGCGQPEKRGQRREIARKLVWPRSHHDEGQ